MLRGSPPGFTESKRSSASSVKPARSASFQLRSLLSSMRISTRRAPSLSKAKPRHAPDGLGDDAAALAAGLAPIADLEPAQRPVDPVQTGAAEQLALGAVGRRGRRSAAPGPRAAGSGPAGDGSSLSDSSSAGTVVAQGSHGVSSSSEAHDRGVDHLAVAAPRTAQHEALRLDPLGHLDQQRVHASSASDGGRVQRRLAAEFIDRARAWATPADGSSTATRPPSASNSRRTRERKRHTQSRGARPASRRSAPRAPPEAGSASASSWSCARAEARASPPGASPGS